MCNSLGKSGSYSLFSFQFTTCATVYTILIPFSILFSLISAMSHNSMFVYDIFNLILCWTRFTIKLNCRFETVHNNNTGTVLVILTFKLILL